jgi:hypothetical protein
MCNSIFSRSKAANSNPNSDFRNLPFGPKPVLHTDLKHVFGVGPAIERQQSRSSLDGKIGRA